MDRYTIIMDQKNQYFYKWSILCKLIYRINAIPIKISVDFFYTNLQADLKHIEICKKIEYVKKKKLKEQEQNDSTTLPDFKFDYNATVNKTVILELGYTNRTMKLIMPNFIIF